VNLGGGCSGAIIASNAILTAAHCIDNSGNPGNPARLSDGQGWNLLHTQQLWHASTVVGMTCDEIFLVVQIWEGEGGEPNGSTIQRIRFDALGEGLPPD